MHSANGVDPILRHGSQDKAQRHGVRYFTLRVDQVQIEHIATPSGVERSMEIENGPVVLEQRTAVFMDIVADDPHTSGHAPILYSVRPRVGIVAITAQHPSFFVPILRDPHRLEHQDTDTVGTTAADQLNGPQSFQMAAGRHVPSSLLHAGG